MIFVRPALVFGKGFVFGVFDYEHRSAEALKEMHVLPAVLGGGSYSEEFAPQ